MSTDSRAESKLQLSAKGQSPVDNFVRQVQELRVGGKYQIVRRIASGSFGEVWLGRDVESGQEVAIKFESVRVDPSLLTREAKIYPELSGQAGFGQVHWYGKQNKLRAMVFELLGPTLEDLFRYCGGKFSLKTTLLLVDQLLHRFESLHRQHYIHRDIKPDNFLLGLGRRGNTVYMADLGFCTESTPKDRISLFAGTHLALIGTYDFASIKGHFGGAKSCCDDLEALGYMLIYFLRGKLPWHEFGNFNRSKIYEQVLYMKQTISMAKLCEDLPEEFATYMEYVKGLQDRNRPDYKYLRKLFNGLFRREKFQHDNVFDWTILEYLRQKQKPNSVG